MSVLEKETTGTPGTKKRSLFALLLVALLALTLMSAIACTPTGDDPNTDDPPAQSQSTNVPNTGGFTVEDTAVVEVDIDE